MFSFFQDLKNVKFKKAVYDSFAKSYAKARAHQKAYWEAIPRQVSQSPEAMKARDLFKSKFGYWDEWSGSRFVRRENPDPQTYTDLKAVCRSCPVTGEWKPL